MEAQSGALETRVIDRLTSEIEEARDPHIATMQAAATVESLSVTRQILQHRIDAGSAEVPAIAVEHARRLAQRGVPPAIMERANRLATDTVMRWCLEQMELLTTDASVIAQAAVLIMTDSGAYGDRVADVLAAAYETERELWLRRSSASREACIEQLLTGTVPDAAALELTLGYRLGQWHLALAVWTDLTESREDDRTFLERSLIDLADRLGCASPPLVRPRANNEMWAWLAVGPEADIAAIRQIVEGWERPVRLAVGSPAEGVAGFRRSHEQAMSAQVVAQSSAHRSPFVVTSAEVGAIALMCADMPATRTWVCDILGPLAVDDAASQRMRETIRVFFTNGASYTATAEHLNMHKNSVVYRLRKAEGQLGRKLRDGRLDLEIALALCHWLGGAVLEAAAAKPGGA